MQTNIIAAQQRLNVFINPRIYFLLVSKSVGRYNADTLALFDTELRDEPSDKAANQHTDNGVDSHLFWLQIFKKKKDL